MSDSTGSSVPGAGWYPDPQNPAQQRWWNGTTWTNDLHGAVAPSPTPAAAPLWASQADHQWVSTGGPVNGGYPPPPSSAVAPPWNQTAPPFDRRAHKRWKAEQYRETRRRNMYGYLGCVFGLLAFIVDFVAIPSVLAVVFGSIGIATANGLGGGKGSGMGWSIWGLVLGLASAVIFVWRLIEFAHAGIL
ncbi:DUF2510 domain-containing protein [Curtobacterium ammoniigenes]|uniref:DUF2510 domain-containing protein n=1 Tax=Curtobacterium ammoniigenes TaxID=395387 RepID=UPI00082B65CA|nr:DUF2510 domain-containing protein [Curtobacterium ammoniigenes]